MANFELTGPTNDIAGFRAALGIEEDAITGNTLMLQEKLAFEYEYLINNQPVLDWGTRFAVKFENYSITADQAVFIAVVSDTENQLNVCPTNGVPSLYHLPQGMTYLSISLWAMHFNAVNGPITMIGHSEFPISELSISNALEIECSRLSSLRALTATSSLMAVCDCSQLTSLSNLGLADSPRLIFVKLPPFQVAGPKLINVSGCALTYDETLLNRFYQGLPVANSSGPAWLGIGSVSNPGNTAIAVAKGWTVINGPVYW